MFTTAARRREEIKECFSEVKQVFLLYLWDSLMTLKLICLLPLVGRGPPLQTPSSSTTDYIFITLLASVFVFLTVPLLIFGLNILL